MKFGRYYTQIWRKQRNWVGLGSELKNEVMMKNEVNSDALRMEILNLHKASINAHLEKDIPFFIQDVSDEYISVSRGEIHRPTIDEIGSTFTNYLENTNFSEYRDLQEPIIGFSEDGSLAWLIAQVKVAGKREPGQDSDGALDFVCAWIMLFKRQDDHWVRVLDVSTFR